MQEKHRLPDLQEIICIVNPKAAHGRVLKQWSPLLEKLHRRWPKSRSALTKALGDATALAERAVREDYALIICVGGDGTVNEVVNGIFNVPLAASRPNLLVLRAGSGCDFVHALGIEQTNDQIIQALIEGKLTKRLVDVGRATLITPRGKIRRYFGVEIDFGISGLGAQIATKIGKPLGGKVTYTYSGLVSLLKSKPFSLLCSTAEGQKLELPSLDSSRRGGRCGMGVVANSPYFGAGMHIAPGARIDDGLLDVVLIEDMPKWRSLMNFPRLFNGTILGISGVTRLRSAHVVIKTDPVVPVSSDGEYLGHYTDLEIELLPRSLSVFVP